MARSILLLCIPFLFVVIASAQHQPTVQWFAKAKVEPTLATTKGPWLAFLNAPTLTVGRYRLAKGASDDQSPHDRDEVYFVVTGKAQLQAGGETQTMGAGDCVFVAAGVPHHFVDIEQDLDVLVFFSAAKATTGGMAAGPTPTEQTAYPETSQRGNTRIFYWFGPDSAGQVSIDFGRPAWQPGFAQFLQKKSGLRWRFGENFWTTLDTNMPLSIGGVDVPIGQYYAVLQNTKEAGLQMVLLDPQEVRSQRLDAYEAPKTKGGLLVPLTANETKTEHSRLDVELTVDRSSRDRGSLVVRFGPHEMSAPVVMQPRH